MTLNLIQTIHNTKQPKIRNYIRVFLQNTYFQNIKNHLNQRVSLNFTARLETISSTVTVVSFFDCFRTLLKTNTNIDCGDAFWRCWEMLTQRLFKAQNNDVVYSPYIDSWSLCGPLASLIVWASIHGLSTDSTITKHLTSSFVTSPMHYWHYSV